MNFLSKQTGGRIVSRFRWKRVVYATVCGAIVCAVFAARFASGSWSDVAIPVGDIVGVDAHDAMISGVMRLHGSAFTLYSGTRIQSLSEGLNVNLDRGGSIALCPRTDMQVLSSLGRPGVMLAFQTGGAQSPFMMQQKDVVMTPDWRIELKGLRAETAAASLLMTMNEKGDVCFQGHAAPSTYFHVSQLAGDAAFDLVGNSMVRFADGSMRRDAAACSCMVQAPVTQRQASEISNNAVSPALSLTEHTAASSMGGTQLPAVITTANRVSDAAPVSSSQGKRRQRPQDVAGYVGSAIHFLFGR